jgi:outer membrane protein assembly factor BamB
MKNKVKLIIASLLFSITLNAESSEVNYITNKVWGLGFPEATASLGACVTGGHLYVHGGHTGATHEYSLDNHSKDFLRIDLASPDAKWEKLPVETLSQGFGMVTHGGLIYQIGGSQATNEKGEPSNLRSIAKCSVFNPKTKKWSKITPLPEPRSSHDVALSDGKIYVTGGWDMGNKKERDQQWFRHGLVADLSRSPLKWEKLPETDWGVRAHATEIFGGKLYVAGGIDGTGTLNTIRVLDLESGKWTDGPLFPGQGRMKAFGMTLCVWNNRLYASAYSSTVRRLSADGSAWEDAGIRLHTRRFFHRMVPATRDRLLFVAGANFESHLDSIEEFRAQPLQAINSWPGFRGDGTSHSKARELPITWSDSKNVAWRIELPGYGQSSPVIWNQQIYTTSTKGDHSETITVSACSLSDGKEIWRQSFESSEPVERSRMVSQAAPTPVVDAAGIYVFFESGDLIALDHKGKKRWQRNLAKDYGPLIGHHGLGSSLCQQTDRLVLLLDHPDPSYLLCFDKRTGKTVWEVKRDKRVSWATPTLTDKGLFISSNGILEEVDLETGQQRWFVDELTGNTVASATVLDDYVYVGSSAKGHSIAVKRGGKGNVTGSHVIWKAADATSSFGSPLVCRNWVYYVSKAGILSCVDRSNGKTLWDRRLSDSTWASSVAADGKLYFFCKDGNTLVMKADGSQTVVAENNLTAESPLYGVALVDRNIIVRSGKNLICVRETKNKK